MINLYQLFNQYLKYFFQLTCNTITQALFHLLAIAEQYSMAYSTSLSLPSMQALQTTEQAELLNVVDSLRTRGLGEITALPQLVVAGDQSSGKSSLLEAISGLPFPRQDGLCTRFATEIILRRAKNSLVSVSIVPAGDSTPADRERLLGFRHNLNAQEDFVDLFERAKEIMGVSGPNGRSFSKDILRVEIYSSDKPQLTLVDLPGLIHSAHNSQVSDDVELVSNLVRRYLRNPRSIILAVVSASNDIAVQIILRRAREVDPHGTRTLGIITKPDTLTKNSRNENAYLALARNEDVNFNLGWHVVKNSDLTAAARDTSIEARDKQEVEFFENSNFGSLPSTTIGISALRTRLSKVLFNQIRVELPRLVDEIEARITECQTQRDRLGPPRTTTQEQQRFLMQLSQSFTAICRDAVKGDYEHKFFLQDSKSERRLCAHLRNMHFAFADNLRTHGARWSGLNSRSVDDASTREEAIEAASQILKNGRGREVSHEHHLEVGSLFRRLTNRYYSYPVFLIPTLFEISSENRTINGKVWPGITSKASGTSRIDFWNWFFSS